MTVKTGSTWAGTFVTLDATGALATPSSGPAGVLYVDGTANAATVTITGSNPYKWSVTLPSLTAGQRVDMYITATIATIATAGFVASAQADTALLSDGVAVASIANGAITAAAIAADAIDADAIKADAITEIQAGLATAAALDTVDNFLDTEIAAIITHLTDIKGAGWSMETLKAIYSSVAEALSNAENTWIDLTDGGRLDLLIDAIKAKTDNLPADPANEATLTAMKGAGWTKETLKALMDYLVTTNGNVVNADGKIDILDQLIDDIKAETITHPTAAEVWSHSVRTLTVPRVTPAELEADNTALYFYKNSTSSVSITGLGALAGATTYWLTFKDNLDAEDALSILQIKYTVSGDTTAITYLNGAAPSAPTDAVLAITDAVTGAINLKIGSTSMALLPTYSAYPISWDFKELKSGLINILAQGTAYIMPTATKALT